MSDHAKIRPTAPPLFQCLIAEFCGTFGLVFIGTGALVVNEITGGDITHVGVSLTFGLTVLAMIYAFGDVSGAHINPAVTVGFWVSGRFEGQRVPGYILVQCAGGIAASGAVRMLFPAAGSLGGTTPGGSDSQSFIGTYSHPYSDAGHFECLFWCQRERAAGGCCNWCSDYY